SAHCATCSATAVRSPSTRCQPSTDPGTCQRPIVLAPAGTGPPLRRKASNAALYLPGTVRHTIMIFIGRFPFQMRVAKLYHDGDTPEDRAGTVRVPRFGCHWDVIGKAFAGMESPVQKSSDDSRCR